VRPFRGWKKLLGLGRVVIEEVEFDERDGALVVSLRPRAGECGRCPHCRRRCPGYDQATRLKEMVCHSVPDVLATAGMLGALRGDAPAASL
jgi:hypothetical protein